MIVIDFSIDFESEKVVTDKAKETKTDSTIKN